jgi:UDP-glucose 4-epimerase
MPVDRFPLVVVLGAAGFVGRHVAKALARQGCQVLGLGHGNWVQAEWHKWGLSAWTDSDIGIEALDRLLDGRTPHSIVHCGGSGSVSFSYAHPLEDFQRATQSTAAVLEWMRLNCRDTCRFVLVSSAAVYGDQGDFDLTERSECIPISPYGVNKVAAEALCESYSRFFGISSSIVRLFSVYGEGLRKQLLWDAMNKFNRGEDHFFGTGQEMRDWLHVDDAARLLCAVALVPQSRLETYNGAHQQATTAQVLQELASVSFPGLTPRFNGETHSGNPRRLTADCGHTRRSLSWMPQTELADGLRRYAQWFQQQSSLNNL